MEPFYGSHQGFQQFMVGIKGFAGGDFLAVCVHEVRVVCGFDVDADEDAWVRHGVLRWETGVFKPLDVVELRCWHRTLR